MAIPVTYFLADVNGVLCVAVRSADAAQPRYLVDYWPTKIHTWDFCRFFECAVADVSSGMFRVAKTMPGEYVITHVNDRPAYGAANRLELKDGSHTLAVFVEYQSVPTPRIGKGSKLEWADGRWVKTLPSGKRVAVYV